MRIDLHRSVRVSDACATDSAKPAASASFRPEHTGSQYSLESLAAGVSDPWHAFWFLVKWVTLCLGAWGVAIVLIVGGWKFVVIPLVEVWHRW